MSVCRIEGCDSKSRTKGLCNKHALRLRLTGTTDPGPKAHATPYERFIRKVEKTGTCWLWRGAFRPNGYGHLQVGGRRGATVSAHRFSYQAHKGEEIPDGMVVMHTCDTPACVNPDHLILGTPKDNMADMWSKGRGRPARLCGEASSKAKLTEEQVRFIRANPDLGHKQIADMWGLSPNAVRGVRIGRTWKHIK